jgi:hypothetical protein
VNITTRAGSEAVLSAAVGQWMRARFWSFLPEASDALEQAGGFVRRVRAAAGGATRSAGAR